MPADAVGGINLPRVRPAPRSGVARAIKLSNSHQRRHTATLGGRLRAAESHAPSS